MRCNFCRRHCRCKNTIIKNVTKYCSRHYYLQTHAGLLNAFNWSMFLQLVILWPWPNIKWQVGDCSFSRFDSIMQTNRQTHSRRGWTHYSSDSNYRSNGNKVQMNESYRMYGWQQGRGSAMSWRTSDQYDCAVQDSRNWSLPCILTLYSQASHTALVQ